MLAVFYLLMNTITNLISRLFSRTPQFEAQAASFDWPAFVRRCLSSPQPFNDALEPYKVTVTHVTPVTGQFWRCLGVYHLSGAENRSNHHLYVDVLDKNGNRINGAKVVARNVNGEIKTAIIDKPKDEAGTNIPVWANDRLTLSVDYLGLPSDTINNLATRPEIPGVIWPDEPGNSQSHNSFGIVLQLMDAVELGGPDNPPDDEPIEEPDDDPIIIPLPPPDIEAMRAAIAAQQLRIIRLEGEVDTLKRKLREAGQ